MLSLFFVILSQIAYRTASNKFPGKLSELFLVLKDTPRGDAEAADPVAPHPSGRGLKHCLEEDQMSVQSGGSKRQDLTSSADKSKKNKSKSTKPKHK